MSFLAKFCTRIYCFILNIVSDIPPKLQTSRLFNKIPGTLFSIDFCTRFQKVVLNIETRRTKLHKNPKNNFKPKAGSLYFSALSLNLKIPAAHTQKAEKQC